MTLPVNLASNSYENCKFLLLDYNSEDGLLEYVWREHREAIESGKLVVYSYPEAKKFNMAHAKNMAHRLGILEGADILVNLDADNYAPNEFAEYLADRFTKLAKHTLMWARMVKGDFARGISGRMAYHRDAFIKVGGYDEQFNTWSPDDKDFNLRLRRLGYVPVEIEPKYLEAIRHNDKMRFREYKHVSSHYEDARLETISDSDTTVVNWGRFGCGKVFKQEFTELGIEISLEPIPTRIFGIGMHKTGTTSLHHALQILGYDSAHWENAHWAKAIWEEMTTWGKSHTIEKNYAISDLPIALLYKELDKAYPGSKFILTVRDEANWIDSIKKHWDANTNPFRKQWNHDPFTHRVHKELYGQKGFNAEIFLNRYRKHNQDVMDYFVTREDLLVLNVDQGEGFRELCKFLNTPMPKVRYPRAFILTRKGDKRDGETNTNQD
jgi:Sulfotransferase domain/N-terminal domain of galactosyltransferase